MLKPLYMFFSKRDKKGFTLIELLIVVAIIAILAAIAIPQFSAYRRRGYNSAATSDLRNMRTTQEAMFADFQDYGSGNNIGNAGTAFTLDGLHTSTVDQTFAPSNGVFATSLVTVVSTKNGFFLAKTSHLSGDQVYGGESDATSTYRHACAAAGACNDTADLIAAPNASTTAADFDANTATWTKM